MVPFVAVTEGVRVTVRPAWVEGQTNPFERRFVFAYFVTVENETGEEVQLLRRAWRIVHGDGRVETVEGDGVVGQQPVIAPGAGHAYTSFVVLTTFTGTMEGTYTMQRPSGERFRVEIPRFHLAAMAG